MDDDFDYDDEYADPYSEDDDEDVRQEFELDEIRSDLSSNPEEARSRLRVVAENLASVHCVDAAFDLFKISVHPDCFKVLMNAIAFAPAGVDSFARLSPLKSSWAILERNLGNAPQRDAKSVLPYVECADVLKDCAQPRLYLEALLCITRLYLKLSLLAEALRILESKKFASMEVSSGNTAWLPSLKYQAGVLEAETCVSMDPLNMDWLSSCLRAVETAPRGLSFPVEKCVISEIRARLFIEFSQLYEAKSLLEKAVRGYEENLVMQGSQYPLIRSLIFLVLVSSIIGNGSFDIDLEVPLVRTLKDDKAISAVSAVSRAFLDLEFSSQALSRALACLEDFLANDNWHLASVAILKLVREALIKLKTSRVLASYNRIKWDSLAEKVGTIPITGPLIKKESALTQPQLMTYILDGRLDSDFRINASNGTVDEQTSQSEWLPQKPENPAKLSIPLPPRYSEFKQSRTRKEQESAILDRWKHKGPHKNTNSRRTTTSAEEKLHELLVNSLHEHRESMAK